jgi:putative hydrolase of the HAD superfamily
MKAVIFDWGDTVMRDFKLEGPMANWERVAWVEGAEELLKALQPYFTCIIATSASHSNTSDMITALKRVGADRYFHQFYSQKELGFQKPDPRFFQAVLDQSALKADDCVMIGNIYEMDIVGAKSVGMTTIFLNENQIPGTFLSADLVVSKLTDAINFLLT